MTPLVFLPGMMCDDRLFGPQMRALGGQRPVSAADLTTQDSIASMARHVLETAPPVFALAGLSMGGIVAMEVLRQAPGRVARLALMDTNPLAETPQVQAGRAGQIARAERGELADMMRDTFIPRYLAQADAGIEALCLDMATELGPEVFARQSRALRERPDQCGVLQGYTGPTLILCGAQDRLCPVERHALMAGLMPHARYRVIPGAGHLPTLEQPDTVTEALTQWLD
ncbi:alpha/beta fold hydrolase [Tropicibacter naphthalenivorans]|uniref:Pimelyl-[acyl-carrier protein] methyl ester esterase n=1 Tax=Tropicibacter naphthalenivorans TaxID=441103 RepID=A0A0P1GIT4_9RHOB|nr:alpha/beta fold hydrolase [Tropicibacter naphthalenivorans]CUH81973.1 Pimelyl-[acyl-carrier protein] methyl ester esterase [Tropicibacter naphthalenivorans]SMD07845.1 Pimeloyl-ACP methyl ester carboxylesterase [Tropicibacter naphthalenivorans]